MDALAVAAAAGALAISATVAWILGGGGLWTRLVVATAMSGSAALFVYAGAGPWQIDYHMAFFAVVAMLAAYADWRAIALAAVLVPLHHVALGRLFSVTPADAGDPSRLIVQVAFIASESIFLIWLTGRFELAFTRQASLADPERTDGLTRLGNHRAYREELRTELERMRGDSTLVLALIDVDDFKAFNEQRGSVHGDRTLQRIAQSLEAARACDRAYRVGGDDFALILPETRLDDAIAIVRKLQREAADGLRGATVSIGLASAVRGIGAHLLHEQAGAALYEAKRRGSNAIVTYGEIAGAAAIVNSSKAEALRSLINANTIDIAFQPIWDLRGGVLLGFEALARPALRFGFDGPQDAFAVAEALHLVSELDALCRTSALARARELPGETLVFVNVSPSSLERRLLPGRSLADLALASGIAPERIVLEITERSSAQVGPVIDEATRLRGLGFKLALDDTGAGNAGLEMLSQMTVDFVKIDGEVIAKVGKQRSARGVFTGIVAIARETGAYLIAEGIEDAPTLASLHPLRGNEESGVAGLQGYLVGRPSLTLPDDAGLGRYEAAVRRRIGPAARPSSLERFA